MLTVTVCGSTAYPELLDTAVAQLTLAGNRVYAPVPLASTPTEAESDLLDQVHRSKIRHSDLVVVLRKPDGTLGEATSAEAAYAEDIGIPVHYIGPTPPPPKG